MWFLLKEPFDKKGQYKYQYYCKLNKDHFNSTLYYSVIQYYVYRYYYSERAY